MGNKKFLTKNEFRLDYNKDHYGKNEEPHPAYITGRIGHKFLANSITHARKTNDGFDTKDVGENPNKAKAKWDNRKSRISPPFWQKDNLFSDYKLSNYRFSNNTRKRIHRYNKKNK